MTMSTNAIRYCSGYSGISSGRVQLCARTVRYIVALTGRNPDPKGCCGVHLSWLVRVSATKPGSVVTVTRL